VKKGFLLQLPLKGPKPKKQRHEITHAQLPDIRKTAFTGNSTDNEAPIHAQ
jgi:hypothetical protein